MYAIINVTLFHHNYVHASMAHTHMNAYTHIHMHTHTYAHTYTHIHTRTHTYNNYIPPAIAVTISSTEANHSTITCHTSIGLCYIHDTKNKTRQMVYRYLLYIKLKSNSLTTTCNSSQLPTCCGSFANNMALSTSPNVLLACSYVIQHYNLWSQNFLILAIV